MFNDTERLKTDKKYRMKAIDLNNKLMGISSLVLYALTIYGTYSFGLEMLLIILLILTVSCLLAALITYTSPLEVFKGFHKALFNLFNYDHYFQKNRDHEND